MIVREASNALGAAQSGRRLAFGIVRVVAEGTKLPIFVYAVRERKLDGAHGDRGWLANLSRLREGSWRIARRFPQEEYPTANRDLRAESPHREPSAGTPGAKP